MPIYDYECKTCKNVFEILHLGKEETKNNICPKCNSVENEKLISIPSPAKFNSNTSCSPSSMQSSCCGGGSCSLN